MCVVLRCRTSRARECFPREDPQSRMKRRLLGLLEFPACSVLFDDLLVRRAVVATVRDWACPLGMPGLTVRYLRTSEAKTRGHLHKRALQEDSVSGRGQKTRREEVQEEESRARLTITVKSSSCSCRRSGLPGRCSWRIALDFVRLAPVRKRLRP